MRGNATHVVCLVLAIQIVPWADDQVTVTRDAAAYWAFDTIVGDATIPDRSGNGHEATIVRSRKLTGPFQPALAPGLRGKAMRCGGSGQYGYFCSIAQPPRLAGPFTVTAWIKPTG